MAREGTKGQIFWGSGHGAVLRFIQEAKQSESGFNKGKTSYSCSLRREERVGGESIPDY